MASLRHMLEQLGNTVHLSSQVFSARMHGAEDSGLWSSWARGSNPPKTNTGLKQTQLEELAGKEDLEGASGKDDKLQQSLVEMDDGEQKESLNAQEGDLTLSVKHSPVLELRFPAFGTAPLGLPRATWSAADWRCEEAAVSCILRALCIFAVGAGHPPREKLRACQPLGVHSLQYLAWCGVGLEAPRWALERKAKLR
ncbi:hypothetical protein NDU88_002103 [Pleurodeles waltl]|uniref:Uncharacterized protein n=1 Tax=Pleurodeles waltl TaxID=8319 RepID=A0AAV7KR92_PLEWA|nr:hypothetical protein NDU88_002103 [Pleurodeles waltl]